MKWWTSLRKTATQYRRLHTQFAELVQRERKLLTVSAAAMFAEVLFHLLGPWPLKYLFDGLLIPQEVPLFGVPAGYAQENPTLFLTWICVAIVMIAGLGGVCAYCRQVWAATAGQRMVLKLRKRLYEHLHRLPIAFHRESRLGDLLIRITGDIPFLRDVLSESAVDLLGRFTIVVGTLVLLFVLDPFLAAVAIGVLVGTLLLSNLFARKIVKVARKQREKEGILAYTANETLAAISLVKAFGREEAVTRAFARKNRSSLREGLKATRFQASLSRWVELLFAGGLVAVLLFGVPRAMAGQLTPGDLLVFVAYIRQLNKPLRRIARTSAKIGKAAACGERVVEILELEPEHDPEAAVVAPRFRGSVTLDAVSFQYPGQDTPALRDISLAIAAGERIGIVGSNGAGKTTLVGLLLGLYAPGHGTIRFDGTQSSAYTLASVREQIAVVLQESYLFGTTVGENLLFAQPGASTEEQEQALRNAGADFVFDHPLGLDRGLSEGGANLSGGERRKLAIAGALLRGAPILVLDEPTTSIDVGARTDLVRRLPELTQGKTTIVISHDPDVLEWLDRIVYLADGQIVACSGHDDLSRESDAYRALVAVAPDDEAGGEPQ